MISNISSSKIIISEKSSFFEFFFKPVDIASLVFFRISFGLLMLWDVCLFFYYGWINEYFIEPTFFFTYYGFDWIYPLPGNGMYVLFIILGILAFFITIGFLYRISVTLFLLGFLYCFLLDRSNYLNHFYLISLLSFLLIFIPAHRAFSVDALIRPRINSNTVPAWGLWILRFQIGIVYFYGGLAKLNSDWLLHGEPMGLFLAHETDIPVIGHMFMERWVVYFFSYGGLLLDIFVVPFLLWKRTRLYAFIAALIFHLLNSQLFSIGIFPWFMIVATSMFFSPDWPRIFLKSFLPLKQVDGQAYSDSAVLKSYQKATVLLILIYVTAQLLLPFHRYLYPGDPSWTEEGQYFSWRMMLQMKVGSVEFIATDPDIPKSWTIDIRKYITLNSRQFRKLGRQPYSILQLSHFLAEELRKEGHENIEIRAIAVVSLNGRRPQTLIDPNVNLVEESYSLLPAKWIMPLRYPLPPPNENIIYKSIRRESR